MIVNRLSQEQQAQVVAMLVEGNSIRSVERMTGIHRDTIMRLTVRVGEHCAALMERVIRDVKCEAVEVDELWTFVGKKQARLTYDERQRQDIGDQYVFVALDAQTKLIPHFSVGKRNMITAYEFMEVLKRRIPGRFQLTTDAFVPYIGAVEMAWGADAPDYAQLVKDFAGINPGRARYSPRSVRALHHDARIRHARPRTCDYQPR